MVETINKTLRTSRMLLQELGREPTNEEIARRELASSQDFEFMAKPFSLGDLTKKVFDVLNQK